MNGNWDMHQRTTNRHLNKQPKFKFLLFKPCRLCNASTFSHYFHPKKAQNTSQNCVLCKKHTYTGISRDGKERKIRVNRRKFSIFRKHSLIHQVIGYLKKKKSNHLYYDTLYIKLCSRHTEKFLELERSTRQEIMK